MERRRAARRPSPEARGASGVQRAPPGARSAAAGGAGAVRVAGGGWAAGLPVREEEEGAVLSLLHQIIHASDYTPAASDYTYIYTCIRLYTCRPAPSRKRQSAPGLRSHPAPGSSPFPLVGASARGAGAHAASMTGLCERTEPKS